ncbi:MAG: hypothetical protein WCP58_04315 [bacterium]
MLNPLFDGFTQQLERVALPLEVTCHRAEDDPRFAPNHSFDRSVQGFGWSDPSCSYTWGRCFLAPSGLEALLLDHLEKADEREKLDLLRRGTSLLVFAMGRLLERMEGAQWLARDLRWSLIDRDGSIRTQRLHYRAGQQVRDESSCDILLKIPRYTILKRISVTEGGLLYSFTDTEIAQLEAAIAEYRGISELLLPVIVEAARVKFDELSSGAWRMIAGTLGISEESARQSFQHHETWWEGYARMHDGGNPET